jgi:hypothetical protein
MIAVKTRLEGVQGLLDQFGEIDKRAAKGAQRKAVTACCRAVRDRAKRAVPQASGTLRKSLGDKVKAYRGGATVAGVVGARMDGRGVSKRTGKRRTFSRQAKRKGAPARLATPYKYLHLAERGRSPVAVKKKRVLSDGGNVFGKKVRRAPGRAFLRRSLEQSQPEFLGIFSSAVMAEIERVAQKARAK